MPPIPDGVVAGRDGLRAATFSRVRVAMMTREYPPEVYGGAGVHVTELVAQLQRLVRGRRALHGRRPATARSCTAPIPPSPAPTPRCRCSPPNSDGDAVGERRRRALAHLVRRPRRAPGRRAVRHPARLTAHSLEPRRPWKAEQLGGGYRLSSWSERNASSTPTRSSRSATGMRADVLDAYPASTRPECTWSTTASTPTSGTPAADRDAGAGRHADRPGRGPSSCSSAGSPGRRASRT